MSRGELAWAFGPQVPLSPDAVTVSLPVIQLSAVSFQSSEMTGAATGCWYSMAFSVMRVWLVWPACGLEWASSSVG
jgi:hypothetical protein